MFILKRLIKIILMMEQVNWKYFSKKSSNILIFRYKYSLFIKIKVMLVSKKNLRENGKK